MAFSCGFLLVVCFYRVGFPGISVSFSPFVKLELFLILYSFSHFIVVLSSERRAACFSLFAVSRCLEDRGGAWSCRHSLDSTIGLAKHPIVKYFTLSQPWRLIYLSVEPFLRPHSSGWSTLLHWSLSDKMRLLLSLVLFLSLSYDSLAAPTALRPQPKSRSFRVERVKRSDYISNGPNALAKAYRKFGLAPTTFMDVDLDDFQAYEVAKSAVSTSTTSSDEDQTGEVTATAVNGDVEFISTVTIGGQAIPMDFDTGSADL